MTSTFNTHISSNKMSAPTGCFIICVTIKNCNTKLAIYARVIGNTSN